MVDDTPDDFTSELPERSQCGNERFRLDYSSILDKSNKTYGDNYEIKTATSTSKPAKKTNGKKRSLSTNSNSTKNKHQRYQDSITGLLQLSESEDDECNYCIFSLSLLLTKF